MDEVTRQRELDRAWSKHEPERDRIPSDIWRRVRAFKRELAPTAAIIENVLKREQLAQPLIVEAIRRRGVPRQKFVNNLRRMLPGANIRICHKEILEISWLSPRPPLFAEPQHPERRPGDVHRLGVRHRLATRSTRASLRGVWMPCGAHRSKDERPGGRRLHHRWCRA